jgi:transposase-like protein
MEASMTSTVPSRSGVSAGCTSARPADRRYRSDQKREAVKRHDQGETLADIARSYNVSPATISRLTA